MACSGRTKRTADEHHAMSTTPKTQSALEGLGMSLRDWFAGQALAGKMGIDTIEYLTAQDIAERCYRQADAMLAARGSDK